MGSRKFVQQPTRRPAGESLRVRAEAIEEQTHEWLIYLAVCPAIVGLAAGLIRAPGLTLPVTLFVASVIWTGMCAWKLRTLFRERVENELGFDGRRRVAEELNRLTAEGFEVYHDVLFDGFHIDHVLVGPPGVFAIETKTRPSLGNSAELGKDRVEFDGYRVKWPTKTESYGLERAVTHARALKEWLSDTLGQTTEVTPVLTLPDWAIDYTTLNPGVLVLSAKDVSKLGDLKSVCLNEDLIRRICHQMNQNCGSG